MQKKSKRLGGGEEEQEAPEMNITMEIMRFLYVLDFYYGTRLVNNRSLTIATIHPSRKTLQLPILSQQQLVSAQLMAKEYSNFSFFR